MKTTTLLRLIAITLFLSHTIITSVRAQDTENAADLQRATGDLRHNGAGGGVSVSPYNGNISYSYPISSHSVGGHPINVSLNYSGSVTYTTFKEHYDGGPWLSADVWTSFKKVQPAWILSVNGIAVQTLSSTANMFEDYPAYRNWLIEGYDYCNRINYIKDGTSDQDVEVV